MKTLENHTLLYDKDCPMCEVYSSTFIKCGMLEKDGRENFSQMSAKNEMIIAFNLQIHNVVNFVGYFSEVIH